MSFSKWIVACIVLVGTVMGAPLQSRREQVTKLVVQIQRADYEGDRLALKHPYNDLAPFADDKEPGAEVRYWRGFAMWRRALNGFSDKTTPGELEQDIKGAVSEFETAITIDAVDLSNSESPQFIGRAVAALTSDPNIMQKSGQILVAAALARGYGFTDVDGKQARPLTLEEV